MSTFKVKHFLAIGTEKRDPVKLSRPVNDSLGLLLFHLEGTGSTPFHQLISPMREKGLTLWHLVPPTGV